MNLRLSQNQQTLLAIFITLMVICEMTAYAVTTPRPQEQFFQLYALGATGEAADYFPNNDTNIQVGEPITWYLGVTNDMGTVQLISIRVKVGNQTIEPPNDTLALESPAPSITEFARFLQNNETSETPFVWSISNATSSGGYTRILTLQINNETYQTPDWSASGGYNFRLVLELWTWQTDSNAFEFGWNVNGEHRVAWLQVWFNVTRARGPEPQP